MYAFKGRDETVKRPNISSVPLVACPLCKNEVNENLGAHLKRTHGEDEFKKAVLKAKESGMSDPEIGRYST